MLGPFATASRRTPIHQESLLSPLSHAACACIDVHDNADANDDDDNDNNDNDNA